ncbi:hypothetical protein ACMU_13500 [Actibacterium mucosum KCTC 23349]|uniref:non-specific protein-tyrosine kinase n=1 Tax=Actibacterium mucosum KCTC 23349 TaxID=1454373 RepID=A0A037ZJF8_9RHOB|nr:polysaccharide biosynthesis tyrosine autokinase [Actibacterium mucosum]KAJ55697.1 hypothetical protein ACMU_13500 [Actibacterium mucosum KCTC 23349]
MTDVNIPPQDTLNLRDLLSVLRRRIRLILFTVLLGVGAALVVLFQLQPEYRSTVLLLVDPTQKNLLNPGDAERLQSASESSRVESEVEIARSGPVLLETVRTLSLVTDPEFGPQVSMGDKVRAALGLPLSTVQNSEALLNGTLQRLSRATEVRRRGLTYLISITVTSKNPERAATIANTMAQVYIDLQIASKTRSVESARDLLFAQVNSARETLANTNDSFDSYIGANIDRLQSETGNARLLTLQDQLLQSEAARSQAELVISASQDALTSRDWSTLANSLEDEALAALVQQREALVASVSTAASGSQQALDLQAQLARLENSIEAGATSQLSSLRADVDGIDAQGDALREQLRNEVVSSDLSSTTLAQLYGLRQEADIAQRQYTNVLSRLRDLDAEALVQVADSRIVSEALKASRPSFPNTKTLLAIALFASVGVGVGLALLNEFYVGGVISATQLANILPAQVVGSVPAIRRKRELSTIADTIVTSPLSAYSEAFRRIRMAIEQAISAEDRDSLVILVASANPAEGKSTTSLALARSYAQMGKSVLLIDGDLRKPSIHSFIDVQPERGLLEYLKSEDEHSDIGEFYVADPLSKVGVIVGRGRSDVPTDQLLMSSKFAEMLNSARKAMDVIIIDTSPLNSVVDAQYVARHADVALLCFRFGETSQQDIRLAHQRAEESVRPGTPVLALLNHDAGRSGGYYYNSGYYSY